MNTSFRLNPQQQQLAEQHLSLVDSVIRAHIQVHRSICGFEYEDLYQEGCVHLCRAAAQYQSDRGIPFEHFARRVIHNGLLGYCRATYRKQKHQYNQAVFTDDENAVALEQIPTDDITDTVLSDQHTKALLHTLKTQYTGITLRGIEALEKRMLGYSVAEIAAMYGVKPNHIGAWISRAKQKMKKNRVFILWAEEATGQKAS